MTVANKSKLKYMPSQRQKYIIIVICVIVLLLIPYILWLGRSNKQPSFLPLSDLRSYQGNSYTFYYPKGWRLTKSALTTMDGTAFLLVPPGTNQVKFSHVDIEVVDNNQTDMNRITNPFTIFRYSQSQSEIDGVDAEKYTNLVDSSEGVLHTTAYVVVANRKIFLISLGYKQSATDVQLESEFSQIVATFKLH